MTKIVKQKRRESPLSRLLNGKAKLYRGDGILGGVCKGIADYFDIDPMIVRLAFVVGTSYYGLGLFAYGALAAFMKPKGSETGEATRLKRLPESVEKSRIESETGDLCGFCQTPVKPAFRFCHRCGRKLDTEPVDESGPIEAEVVQGE